jgi:DNA-binding SARP family transcriptional activator
MNSLRFSLLGPVRAWHGEQEIDLGSPQQRALLAVLLLRLGEPVTIADAAHALWGEAIPPSAFGTVRTYIYRLRRKMTEIVGGPGFALRSHSSGYVLTTDGATIDTHLFQQHLDSARTAKDQGEDGLAIEHFRAALALWRGTPIAGMCSSYFDAERERLEQLHAAAIEELTSTEITVGDHASAVTTLKAALAAHPLWETLWELLLQALAGLGRRADALAAYQDARHVLRAELGLEPGPRLQELHLQILSAVPSAAGGPPRAAGIRRVRCSLPAQASLTPHGFFGRAAELSAITASLLDPGSPTLVGLAGPPRAGKSALGVRAAHLLRPHFPDGQLYATLTGWDGTPMAPEVVLVEFLSRCEIPADKLPQSLPALAALWKSVTDGMQLLVVLDDVCDSAQVRPLLPSSAESAVLLIGRHQLTDPPGPHRITLGVLTLPDALQLLGAIIGHDRLHQDVEASARLVAACGYRPHVVRLAASRLLTGPYRTLQDLERELRSGFGLPHFPAADEQGEHLGRALVRA